MARLESKEGKKRKDIRSKIEKIICELICCPNPHTF